MKKLYLVPLLLLAVNIARAQDFVLKAVSDHFSISQNGQGINIYGNDIKDNLGNYFLKANGTHNTLAWSSITGTPTTLAGYGITDGANYTASNGIAQSGNNFSIGGPSVTTPIGIRLANNGSGANGKFTLKTDYYLAPGYQTIVVDGFNARMQAIDTTLTPIQASSGSTVWAQHHSANLQALLWKTSSTGAVAGVDINTYGTGALDANAKSSFGIYANDGLTNFTQGIFSRYYAGGNTSSNPFLAGIEVVDDPNTIGFIYKDKNYDGRNRDNWIPDWYRVKSRIDSAITANANYTSSNGITKTSNNFALGGALTGQTDIATGTYLFRIGSSFPTSSGSVNTFGATQTTLELLNSSWDTKFYQTPGSLLIWNWTQTGAGGQSISLDSTNPITITDSHTNKGVVYAADYSANYVARSLIDKGYADATYATTASATYTASNGIIKTGNNFTVDQTYLNGLYASLAGNNTFGGMNTFNGALVGNNSMLMVSPGSAPIQLKSKDATSSWYGTTLSLFQQTFSLNGYENDQNGYGGLSGAPSGNGYAVNVGVTYNTVPSGHFVNGVQQLQFNSSSKQPATFYDDYGHGLQYSGNWHANIRSNPRAIPDIGLVDSLITASGATGSPAWSSITGKPTTLSGYAITDAVNITSAQTVAGVKTFSNDINAQGNIYMTGNIFANDSSPYFSRNANDTRYLLLTGGTVSGNTGFGVSAPAAKVDIAAGTTTAAPLHIAAGTNLTTPVSGSIENDGTNLYYTNNSNIRQALLTTSTSNTGANPTASIGLTAINGSATTYMRSDAAPALSQSITPTWTGLHIYNAGLQIGSSSTAYIGIGQAPLSRAVIVATPNLTGGTSSFGVQMGPTIKSDITSIYTGFNSSPSTQAASFTLGSVWHFAANGMTIGAGSAVTSQIGFFANSTLNTATNNYGFYGNIASQSNTYNLYMGGTAQNYLAGNTGFGVTTPSAKVDIAAGSATVAPLQIAAGTNLTAPVSGAIENDGTNLYYTDNTSTRRILNNNDYEVYVNDANYIIPSGQMFVQLSSTTASRVITLPSPASCMGQTIKIWTNTSGTWSFSSTNQPVTASRTPISTLTNSTVYILEAADNATWVKIN